MNNIRRKEIRKVKETLENLLNDIDMLKLEEEEAYDNMPESLQESDRGGEMLENIEYLDEAYNAVDEAIETLGNIY